MNEQKSNQFGWPSYNAITGEIHPGTITEFNQFTECMLGIDLGARNFRDGRLEACVDWISDNFDYCIVAIADTAHQYTLQLTKGMNPATAHEEALRMGETFVHRNRQLFEQYNSKCKFDFKLLSEFVESTVYKENNRSLQALLKNDSAFAQSVEAYAKAYPRSLNLGSQIFNELEQSESRQLQLAISHLIEELTMYAFLKQERWPVLVYPRNIAPLSAIVDGKHPDAPDALKTLVFTSPKLQREKAFFTPERLDAEERIPEDFELLPDFTDDEWEKLISYTTSVSFSAEDVLVEYGQEDRSMYILAQGMADIFLTDTKDGSQKRITTIEKGTVFGEMALLDGRPRSATVIALTGGLLFRLSLDDLNRLRTDDPDMACALLFDIGRVLALRNRHMNDRI